MTIKPLVLLGASLLLSVGTINAETRALSKDGGKVVHHETQGNLEVTHVLGCIGIDKVKNEYTPADLYPAIAKCTSSGEYEQAAETFMVAGAFGRFDKLRVSDTTAHQAMEMLLMHALDGISEDKKSKFHEAFKKGFAGDKLDEGLCTRIRSLGHPSYFPRYMIQHGMEAFLPNASKPVLVENFDPVAAWNQVLKNSFGCPDK